MSLIPDAIKHHIGEALRTYRDVKPFAAPIAADMAGAVLDSKLNVHGNSFIIRTVEPLERQVGINPTDIGRHGISTSKGSELC
jgi:hypothetical protein